jgi:SAM-dependent methyltransferase
MTADDALRPDSAAGCASPNCCTPPVALGLDQGAASAGAARPDPDAIRSRVQEGYAAIAQAGGWSAAALGADAACVPGGGCCGPATFSPEQLAEAIGYAASDLAGVPEGANMGLSCGNPAALAALRPGEVVLDLGAGGGFDCFIAGSKVGASGRVIGVDMTPQMLAKARGNLAAYAAQSGLGNVEFRLGEIEHLPVADASVDVVISNCVLNLSPDKPQVWREIARVLKPGGRVAVSDLALLKPLPAAVREDLEALVGCVAGAVLVEEIRADAAAAGLAEIRIDPKPSYIDAMVEWQDPLYRRILAALPEGSVPSAFIVSVDLAAVKPA